MVTVSERIEYGVKRVASMCGSIALAALCSRKQPLPFCSIQLYEIIRRYDMILEIRYIYVRHKADYWPA